MIDQDIIEGKSPEYFLEEARQIRTEIAQIFSDAEHWNASRTVFEQVDPDPHGEMAALAVRLDKFIEQNSQ